MEKITIKQSELLEAYVIPYENKYENWGWGCGYVKVHKSHPYYKKCKIITRDAEGLYTYPQERSGKFCETITYFNFEGDFLVIGFDSAGLPDKLADKYPKDVIIKETMNLYDIINDYTVFDLDKLKQYTIKNLYEFLNNL